MELTFDAIAITLKNVKKKDTGDWFDRCQRMLVLSVLSFHNGILQFGKKCLLANF